MNLGKIMKKLIKGILWCFAIIVAGSVLCVILFDDEDQHSNVELEQQRQEAQTAATVEASEEEQVNQKKDSKSVNKAELDEYVNPADTWEQNDSVPDNIPQLTEEQEEQMVEDARYTPFGSDDPHAIWLGKSFSISLVDDPDSNCDVVLENVRHEVKQSNDGIDGNTFEPVYSYHDYIFLDFDIENTSKSNAAFSFGQGNDCIVSDGYVDEGMQIDGMDMLILDMDFGWKELAPGLKLKYTVVFKLDADMWNHKEIYYQFASGYRFYLMKDGIITPSIPLE